MANYNYEPVKEDVSMVEPAPAQGLSKFKKGFVAVAVIAAAALVITAVAADVIAQQNAEPEIEPVTEKPQQEPGKIDYAQLFKDWEAVVEQ